MDQRPHTKCKGVHWNPIGRVRGSVWLLPPILTIGGGFHSNARHVNSVNQAQDSMTVTKIKDLPKSLLPTHHLTSPDIEVGSRFSPPPAQPMIWLFY